MCWQRLLNFILNSWYILRWQVISMGFYHKFFNEANEFNINRCSDDTATFQENLHDKWHIDAICDYLKFSFCRISVNSLCRWHLAVQSLTWLGTDTSNYELAANTVNLHANWSKTKLQNVGTGPNPSPSTGDGHSVEPVTRFTDLGSDIEI